MKNVESIAEHREKLRQAFDALEMYLQNTNHSTKEDATHAEKVVLQEQIKELTTANENLQRELKHVTDECSELRMACSKGVDKLNSLIGIVQTLAEQEREDAK
ncbi:hypothetical protein [Anaplasma bovis]|uniref:hypothetical protein n=1 Tax=Anaplasma bovis TaxID=186733 RepID=UPI002FF3B162